MPTNAQLVDYLLPIETRYVLGGSRYEPYNTDCSGVVCAAYWHVFGLDPSELGTWTGGQWSSPATVEIWSGTSADLPWDSMQKGDMIFTSTESAGFDTVNGSHVGFYTGNPYSPFLSHFADGGPYVTRVNSVYGGRERFFGVKRYMPGESEDDVSAQDVWTYKNKDMNGNDDAYQVLTDIKNAVTGEGVSSWGYKNKRMNGDDDTYQLLTDINKNIKAVLKKLG